MDDGTKLFLGTLAAIGDGDLDRPTALPGWTGRHLVAHVHYNARALLRLTRWAATGQESRMYASPGQRSSEIEEGATRPAAELRDLVQRSAGDLEAALLVEVERQRARLFRIGLGPRPAAQVDR